MPKKTLVDANSGNDSIAPDFAWVKKDGVLIGWEGSFKLDKGNYGQAVEIHVNHGGRTSSTGKGETAGGEILDTGDLSGDDGAGTVSDPEPGIIPDPKLDIETKVQGFDADEPTGPYIEAGDKTHWLYTVTNTGNVPLSNIVVADSKEGVTPNCDGDNIIDMLLPDESLTCSASGVAVIGQQENLGSAETVYGGSIVFDEDKTHYFGAEPGIDIETCVSGAALPACSPDSSANHDNEPGELVLEGSEVFFTYTVTNTGNVPLTGIQVQDGLALVCPKDTLQPNESMTCAADTVAVQGPYVSEGTAVGSYEVVNEEGNSEQREVQDMDISRYYALSTEQPSLVLTVTDFAVTGDANQFSNGAFIVENASGGEDVTAVAVQNVDIKIEYRSSLSKNRWVSTTVSKNCTTDPAVPFVFEGPGEWSETPAQQKVQFRCTVAPDEIPAGYSTVRATVCAQIFNRYDKKTGAQKWFCSSSDN